MRTAPIPSQSAIRARTPGAAASVAATTATTTSAAIAAARARGLASQSRSARRDRRPRPPPVAAGAVRLGRDPCGDGAGEVGGGRPGDLVAQQGEPPLEVGHGATTSPAPARSSSARIRPSARDSRDFTVPGRQPSAFGRLALGEVEQVAAGDHRAVALVERSERGEQLPALAAGEQRGLGRRSRVPRGPLLRGAEREARAPPGGAAAVAGLVGDDREQPRPERRVGAGSAAARATP